MFVFVVAAVVGVCYVATYRPVPYFLQQMFGPAVLWACGRGYENPRLADVPGLPDDEALIGLMGQDKKVRDGRLRFVLARGIGEAFVAEEVPLDALRATLAASR